MVFFKEVIILLLFSRKDRGSYWRCVCGSFKGVCDLSRERCIIIVEVRVGWLV